MTCDSVASASRAAWRFLLLADFASLAGLRRHLGRARTSLLARDVGARAHAVLPEALLQPTGRYLLEIDAIGDSPDDLIRMADRLVAAFDVPLDVDGERHRVELAIGGSFGPIGGIEEVLLLEAAEDALAQSQLERRPVIRDAQHGLAADRLTLGRDLAGAAARGELFLQYQPKLHVRRQQVTSVEALMRWTHPDRGLVLPSDFIPLAETTQAIGPMTLWALERVIADYHVLRHDGHDLTIFVNISGQLLSDVPFIDEACRLVTSGGARIGFEITETSVIRDPDLAIEHLKRIADHGVPIAIDDYGAGLSSLAYLKKLPATELKIDKMFVMELTSSHRDPLIVRSTIDLAHAMEMEVTAEGVETPAALALLSVMGCDLVQGFLLSRPIGLEALRHYLQHDVQKAGAGIPPFDLRKRA